MEDDRVWAFEESLWRADPEHYREAIDPDVRMALPQPPFVFAGAAAVAAVARSPRWTEVRFADGTIARPQHGLIVVAYTPRHRRGLYRPLHQHLPADRRPSMASGAAPADPRTRHPRPGQSRGVGEAHDPGVGHRQSAKALTKWEANLGRDCSPN